MSNSLPKDIASCLSNILYSSQVLKQGVSKVAEMFKVSLKPA